VIGIDPAPTKPAVLYDGTVFRSVTPPQIRKDIIDAAQGCSSLLIAWDAPLSFANTDFYDRLVDKAARAWIKKQVTEGHFSPKAVNARPFAGLAHWAISCFTLGLPFGKPPHGLTLLPGVPTQEQIGLFAVEVHPAVAMGAKWISLQFSDPFPRYKGNPTACAEIAQRLGFLMDAGTNDDTLDAYAAYWLGQLFLSGEASWLGDPATGGYVMPDCGASNELYDMLSVHR
jgi:predicted RNase H-like nuclease